MEIHESAKHLLYINSNNRLLKEASVPLDQIGKTARLNEFQNDCKLVLCLDCINVLHYVGVTKSFKKTDLLGNLALHV